MLINIGNSIRNSLDKRVSASDQAKQLILKQGGIIHTADALRAGIHARTIYALRDSGALIQISRGVYRLSEMPTETQPDLITVALRSPKAVICLISALSFHELTTQIPHSVSIALTKGAESPRIDYPPITVHRFSDGSFAAGIEEHKIDGVPIRIYNAEKTLIDCFKFRNKIGMDVVLEAFKFYKTRKSIKLNLLLEYAKICRVDKIIKPYLEVMT